MMSTNAPEEKKKYYFDFFLFVGLIMSIILLVHDIRQKQIEPKQFITLSHKGTVKKYGLENQNIVLDCIADGYPKPSITWFHYLPYSWSDNKFRLYNGSLKIINLSSTDEGYYICEAKNTFGSKKIEYNLLVDKPQINEYLDHSLLSITPAEQKYIQTNMFNDVTLKCNATGKITPTVTWYYNDTQIGMTVWGKQWEFSDKNKFLLQNGDLRIIDLSLDDGGSYACEAINKYGRQKIRYSLTVTPIKSKYQWISSDERRANFANRKLVKMPYSTSNDYIGRMIDKRTYITVLARVSLDTGIAYYNDFLLGSGQTTNYELLEVYGNYEWKRVINQTIPSGAVELDGRYLLIGRKNNSMNMIYEGWASSNLILGYVERDLEILVVT